MIHGTLPGGPACTGIYCVAREIVAVVYTADDSVGYYREKAGAYGEYDTVRGGSLEGEVHIIMAPYSHAAVDAHRMAFRTLLCVRSNHTDSVAVSFQHAFKDVDTLSKVTVIVG